MKIIRIEYENFRNFKGKGHIECSTDGKITVIYGKNGDGKTTLHQLFQWVFYGTVNFNKTATEHLYNLSFEKECPLGKVFEVKASVEFEHSGRRYFLTRKNKYQKELNYTRKLNIKDGLILLEQDDDFNWREVKKPVELIESCLPSGLAEYFFFDGEGMIADLRVKGKEAATKLKKTFYTMFELDVIQDAISHIGSTSNSSSILGKLYATKGENISDARLAKVNQEREDYGRKIKICEYNKGLLNKEKDIKTNRINEISEEIGQNKQKINYENERKRLKSTRDKFLSSEKSVRERFGNEIIDMFPTLLISKAIKNAQYKINLKANETKLPLGITKELIYHLIKDDVQECICGRALSNQDKQVIKDLLNLMPPYSYDSIYLNFKSRALRYEGDYDKDKLDQTIKEMISNIEGAYDCEQQIKLLDEKERNRKDIDELIDERLMLEKDVRNLESKLSHEDHLCKNFKAILNKYMKEYDKLTQQSKHAQEVNEKIEIMQKVLLAFTLDLEHKSLNYSKELQKNIQYLLDNMLTSKRIVNVNKDFSVRVTDSYDDESKSEGQFAVVSFAYIGGILKMLKDADGLESNEYPLVLDGPFSKLDVDQRQNVVNMLPTFAPQVILFSKDDLTDVIPNNYLGHVYTIQSNIEKNIASIKEGKLWK